MTEKTVPAQALRDEEQNRSTINLPKNLEMKNQLLALLQMPESEQNRQTMDSTLLQLSLLDPEDKEWSAKPWPSKLEAIREILEAIEKAITLADPAAVTALTVKVAESAKTAVQAPGTKETKETSVELTAVIEKMEATAEKHNNFGFGSAEALAAFLEQLPQKLSPDSLATLRALKPRETEESYTVFFKEGNQIFLGESAPSSKGADGKEGNGVMIAADEAGKALGHKNGWMYSETGSAEALFAQLEKAGARDITRASKSMLKTLQGLKLFSGSVLVEWLSDPAAPGYAWVGDAEDDYSIENAATYAFERRGVRALRNVTSELGA